MPALARVPLDQRRDIRTGAAAACGRSVSASTGLEIDEQHRVGADARAVIGHAETMVPMLWVAIGLAEGEVRGKHSRSLVSFSAFCSSRRANTRWPTSSSSSTLALRVACELAALTNTNAATCTSASSATKNTMMRVCGAGCASGRADGGRVRQAAGPLSDERNRGGIIGPDVASSRPLKRLTPCSGISRPCFVRQRDVLRRWLSPVSLGQCAPSVKMLAVRPGFRSMLNRFADAINSRAFVCKLARHAVPGLRSPAPAHRIFVAGQRGAHSRSWWSAPRQLGMPAVAVTDQNNLFAMVKFYRARSNPPV